MSFLACLLFTRGYCDGNVVILWLKLYKSLTQVLLLKLRVEKKGSNDHLKDEQTIINFWLFFHYTWEELEAFEHFFCLQSLLISDIKQRRIPTSQYRGRSKT